MLCSSGKHLQHQNNADTKIGICFGVERRYCDERRKCCLPAFYPLSRMILRGHFLRGVKTWLCGKE